MQQKHKKAPRFFLPWFAFFLFSMKISFRLTACSAQSIAGPGCVLSALNALSGTEMVILQTEI
jgi:hypothetical protein